MPIVMHHRRSTRPLLSLNPRTALPRRCISHQQNTSPHTHRKVKKHSRLNPTLCDMTCKSSGLPSSGQSSQHRLIISFARCMSGSAVQSLSCRLPPRMTPPPLVRGNCYARVSMTFLPQIIELRMWERRRYHLQHKQPSDQPASGYADTSSQSAFWALL